MRPLRRPTRSTIVYHGLSYGLCGSHNLTFSINGVRWEYSMSAIAADSVLHVVKVASAAKALPLAKSKAHTSHRITPTCDGYPTPPSRWPCLTGQAS